MNEANKTPAATGFSKRNFSIVAVVALVLVLSLGATVSNVKNDVRDLSDKVDKLSQQAAASASPGEPAPAPVTTVASGKGSFTMNVPNNWGPLLKDTESDFFIMPGMMQPAVTARARADIKELKGFGSDGPSLFVVMLSKEGVADSVRGVGEEFTIGKGEDVLVGKKYSYIFPEDTIEGIGHPRYQNDREYRYTFATKDGRKLDIIYNVYGVDPRNNEATVDDIVHSIVVK